MGLKPYPHIHTHLEWSTFLIESSALSLGNRTIMMNNGAIVLDIAGQERADMTPEKLLKVFHQQGISNDRIELSAE